MNDVKNKTNDDSNHDYEFSQSEEEFLNYDTNLYDDILFESNDIAQIDQSGKKLPNENVQQNPDTINNHKSTSRDIKYQLYIGNLTWWTTDQCIADCLTSIGVFDLIDINFFENQISGQSEGFCIITLSSEQSIKLVQNELPKEKLYGKSPVVTFVSKEAYVMFNSKSNSYRPPLPIDQNTSETPDQVKQQYVSNFPFVSIRQPQNTLPLKDIQPLVKGTTTDLPHLRYHDFLNTSNQDCGLSRFNNRAERFQIMPPTKQGSLRFGRRNHPSYFVHNEISPLQGYSHQILINPYLNTTYYQQPNNANETSLIPCMHNKMDISAQKVEEIMKRNRTVSSSAIARAITNASDGEFSSAIETLATAIMLIKESKIAKHECSKALISSLENILHNIEIKRNHNSRKEKSKLPRNKLHRKSQHRRFREYECRDGSREYTEKNRFKYYSDHKYKNDKDVKQKLSFNRRTIKADKYIEHN